MEAVWGKETKHQRFWRQLLNDRVNELLNDPEKVLLRHMRHDYEMVKRHLHYFGAVLKERNLCLYKLIAEACGEVWDEEDEEKHQKIVTQLDKRNSNAVSLDHPREICVRQGQGEGPYLQAGDGESESDLQAWRRRGRGGVRGAQEETPT